MNIITYTEVRKDFNKAMDVVCNEHMLTVITRPKKEPVVVMSLSDYNSIEETMYLMKSPRNHAILLQSMKNAREGINLVERELIEVEE